MDSDGTTAQRESRPSHGHKRPQRRSTIPAMKQNPSPMSSPTTSSPSSIASPSALRTNILSPRLRSRKEPHTTLRKRLSADFSDYTYSGDSGGESPKNEWRIGSAVNGPFLTGPLSNDYRTASHLDELFKSPRSLMKKSIADVENASGLLFPVIPDYVPPAITMNVYQAQQTQIEPEYPSGTLGVPPHVPQTTPSGTQGTSLHLPQNEPSVPPPQQQQQWYDHPQPSYDETTMPYEHPYHQDTTASSTTCETQAYPPPSSQEKVYSSHPSVESTTNWYDQAYSPQDKSPSPTSPVRMTPPHSSNTSRLSTSSTSAAVLPTHKSPFNSQIVPSQSPEKPATLVPPAQSLKEKRASPSSPMLEPVGTEPQKKSSPTSSTQDAKPLRQTPLNSTSSTQDAFDRLSEGIAESVDRILATTKDGKTHAEIELSCLIQKIQTHLKIMGRVSCSIKESYDRTRSQLEQAVAEKQILEASNQHLQRVIEQFEGERLQFHEQLKRAQELHDTMLKETVQHLTDKITKLTEASALSTTRLEDQMTTTSSAVVAATTEAVAAASTAAEESTGATLSAELVKQVDEIRDVLDHLVEQTNHTPSAPPSPTKKQLQPRASSPSRPPSRRFSYRQERRPSGSSWKSFALSGFVVGAASLCGVYVGVNQAGRSMPLTPATAPSLGSTQLQESDLVMIVDRLTQSLVVQRATGSQTLESVNNKAGKSFPEAQLHIPERHDQVESVAADVRAPSKKEVLEMEVTALADEAVELPTESGTLDLEPIAEDETNPLGSVDNKAGKSFSETQQHTTEPHDQVEFAAADVATPFKKEVVEMEVTALADEAVELPAESGTIDLEPIAVDETKQVNEAMVEPMAEVAESKTEVEAPTGESTVAPAVDDLEVGDAAEVISTTMETKMTENVLEVALNMDSELLVERRVEPTIKAASGNQMLLPVDTLASNSSLDLEAVTAQLTGVAMETANAVVPVESSKVEGSLESSEPFAIPRGVDVALLDATALIDEGVEESSSPVTTESVLPDNTPSNEVTSIPAAAIETFNDMVVTRADMCKPWAQALHVWCPSLFDVTGQDEFPTPPTLDASPLGGLARALTSLSEYVAGSEGTQLEVPVVKDENVANQQETTGGAPIVVKGEPALVDDVLSAGESVVGSKEIPVESIETSSVSRDVATLDEMEQPDPVIVPEASIDQSISEVTEALDESRVNPIDAPVAESIPKSTGHFSDEPTDSIGSTAAAQNTELVVLPVCESNATITSPIQPTVEVVKDSVSDNWSLAMRDSYEVISPTESTLIAPEVVVVDTAPTSEAWKVLEHLEPIETHIDVLSTEKQHETTNVVDQVTADTILEKDRTSVTVPSSVTNESISIETMVDQLDVGKSKGFDANAVLITHVEEVVTASDVKTRVVSAQKTGRLTSNTAPRWVIDQVLVGIGAKSGPVAPMATVDEPSDPEPAVRAVPLVDVEGYATPSRLSIDVGEDHTNATQPQELDIVETQPMVAETDPVQVEAPSDVVESLPIDSSVVAPSKVVESLPIDSQVHSIEIETTPQPIEDQTHSIQADAVEIKPTHDVDSFDLPDVTVKTDVEVVAVNVSSNSVSNDEPAPTVFSESAKSGTSSKTEQFLSYIMTTESTSIPSNSEMKESV